MYHMACSLLQRRTIPLLKATFPFVARFSEYTFTLNITNRYTSAIGPNKDIILDNYLNVPIENCRTFSIIAHIDHGKSTLADSIMKYAGNLKQSAQSQFLDNLEVERERGITVKAQTASMLVRNKQDNENYLLNLIFFSYLLKSFSLFQLYHSKSIKLYHEDLNF